VEVLDSVVTDGLVGWYRFEDGDARDYTAELGVGSNQTAFDGTVNGATFQSSAGVTDFENGSQSGAFDFDGTDDSIVIPNTKNNFFNYPRTVMAFINADQVSFSLPQPFLGSLDFKSSRAAVGVGFGTQSNFLFELKDGSNAALSRVGSVTAGEDTHLAVTADSSTVSLFVDGAEIDSVSHSLNQVTVDHEFAAGEGEGDPNTRFFNGVIDDFRIYDRALSQSEIQTIFDNTKP
jgi:hypothetical protein